MPEICRFFGIVIAIFYNDHAPPHFHVRYGNQRAIVSIETLEILDGVVSARALGMVLEWASRHRFELRTNWDLARRHLPLRPIAPLE